MVTLIQNVEVYAPEHLGKKDLLIADKRIAKIADNIEPAEWMDTVDAKGKILIPGLIDGHVHITGGGGEGGFRSRTPELMLTDATMSGVTTLVGVIGTDGTTRTMTNLLAKAKALNEEGVTCYIHTGSYQIPVRTLTDKIEDDLMLIDLIIGTGEIAIADHRSSQPTVVELAKLASQSRIGGMLSGKNGVVNIHVGDGPDRLHLIEEVVATTNIPITQFYPTHINRNSQLFEDGIEYAKNGGYVDFTTSTIPKFLEDGEVKAPLAVKKMLDAGVPVEQMTMTSDAQGSLPEFDEQGRYAGMKVGRVRSLYEAFIEAVQDHQVPLEKALQTVTENPASILGLPQKGRIEEGKDADFVLLNPESLEIDSVYAMGRKMVDDGVAIVCGTFE
ncbi:beta-aspartyl-peptidase [Halobacillus salinus]|uniref:Isoaspartyl dipeptidase n=1 Tax=Halobacillus salinus TaxID=192814 RepID=A0A4Z0GYP3_9BACI|nr:beta-aspartyl-peptidase [Halobacillus salinus]TGB02476.1 beta-aspartyl-peptidase [Halobacillus salinus]